MAIAPVRSRRRGWKWIVGTLVVLAAAVHIHRRLADPSIPFLASESGASWLRFPDPFLHTGRPAGQEVSFFRKRFSVGEVPARAILTVRALRIAIVQVDRQTVGRPRTDPSLWKESVEVDLAPSLKTGAHELQIAVLAANGPACALASCPELGLATGSGWEASHDGNSWRPAVRVDAIENPSIGSNLPSVPSAFGASAPWLLLLFAGTVAWTIARTRGRLSALACTPGRVRWILVAAWVVLAANNILKVPLDQGFDVSAHVDYVRYILQHRSVPLASEGWEMYQAPLAYVLMALLQRALETLGVSHVEPFLRLLPLACGALQVEVAYRTLRHAFRDREDLQCLGVWIAGLIPMSLYVSQVVGNEPLAGVTSAFVVCLCVQALCRGSDEAPLREAAWIGLALGVALLSKMTALLLVPLAGGVLFACASARGRSPRSGAARTAVAWGVATLVSGWFYARNWIALGKPFVGNWDWKETNRIWWQDPGYRIPEHFTRFGRSLVHPVYAAVNGFWDALYSTLWTDGLWSGGRTPPPWNLDWMLAGAWLGLPITAAVAVGMLRRPSASPSTRRAIRLAAFAVLVYVAVALDFYLGLPIYSCAKATYFLGLLPCFALLAAAASAPLLERTWTRALVHGWLVCAGFAFYAAYFVR